MASRRPRSGRNAIEFALKAKGLPEKTKHHPLPANMDIGKGSF